MAWNFPAAAAWAQVVRALYGRVTQALHQSRDQTVMHLHVQSSLSLWEVCYSSLLHPERHNQLPSGRTSAVHHRIALFNSDYKITQIISQSDIVKLVSTNRDGIRECLNLKLLDVPGMPAVCLRIAYCVVFVVRHRCLKFTAYRGDAADVSACEHAA
jgi:hypothetical protein